MLMLMKSGQVLTLLALLMLFLVGGCGSEVMLTASPINSPLGPSEALDGLPGSPATVLPLWNMTPENGKATLRGRIELRETNMLLGELYLAKAVPTSNSEIELLELDEAIAPRAVIDRDSLHFVFVNVVPGRYGLIAWEPMSSYAINDPDTGETLFIDIAPDQVIDMGVLYLP